MKTIGLIGGMSWESTAEYYRIINQTIKEKLGKLHSAKCIMYSVEFEEITTLLHQSKWEELTNILVNFAQKLESAGADFIAIATNTMHKLAEEIQNNINIPLLHIADTTADKIIEKGLRKPGLLGTKFTMEENFYRGRLKEKYNIETVIPPNSVMKIIDTIIFDELCRGIIKESSKEKFKEIIKGLIENGADGVILGCTEIPLLISQEDVEVTIFDTTMIHSQSIVEFALQ